MCSLIGPRSVPDATSITYNVLTAHGYGRGGPGLLAFVRSAAVTGNTAGRLRFDCGA
jgi:hypothetical protein